MILLLNIKNRKIIVSVTFEEDWQYDHFVDLHSYTNPCEHTAPLGCTTLCRIETRIINNESYFLKRNAGCSIILVSTVCKRDA